MLQPPEDYPQKGLGPFTSATLQAFARQRTINADRHRQSGAFTDYKYNRK